MIVLGGSWTGIVPSLIIIISLNPILVHILLLYRKLLSSEIPVWVHAGAIDDKGYLFASTYRAISREEEKFAYDLY